ncbi:MAG: HD domain-containing protein, partial [Chloroflexi bacterium]|nr:HD domain-containing protein [Chloroflexota bacterium]
MVSQPGKPKFIRDPIHDIIRIKSDDQFILRLLDSAPMQRLRRIGQLGLAQLVYPGAEHSRFTHSLGVFHLAGRVMAQLEEEAGEKLFEGHRQAVLAAALLHDIGH